MTKEQLILEGERILNVCTQQKDVFNIGSLDYVISDAEFPKLKEWDNNLHLYALSLENTKIAEEIDLLVDSFVDNNSRVSKERIANAIKLLKIS